MKHRPHWCLCSKLVINFSKHKAGKNSPRANDIVEDSSLTTAQVLRALTDAWCLVS
jgi:hypothetical protein